MVASIHHLLVFIALISSQPRGELQSSVGAVPASESTRAEREADTENRPTVSQPDIQPGDGLHLLGQMLDRSWQDRPEWADMAAGILKGRAMGRGNGWFHPARKRHDWSWLREELDTNDDARVTLEEYLAAAAQRESWFERLDRDLSGDLTERDFDWTGRLARRGDDAASTATDVLFDRADTDSNGRITRVELLEFFAQADRDGGGFWTPEDLYATLVSPEPPAPSDPQSRAEYVEKMLEMLFAGQLGWFEPGPDVGEAAPDFTLATHDGAASVTLSESFGKKPTVLLFGSFT